MRLELLPQVGHEVYGTSSWLRFRSTRTMCIPIQRERESQKRDKSVVYTLKKREFTRDGVNFEQKNDYESEKIVKIIREAKKLKGTTLGSAWI